MGFTRFKIRFRMHFNLVVVNFKGKISLKILFFLPLSRGRTYHPRFPELLAHGFSPALSIEDRVGSSTLRGGWPLASLICGLLTALCEPHAPCLFRLAGDRTTTNCSDRQVTALVADSEQTEEDMSRDMLLRSWF